MFKKIKFNFSTKFQYKYQLNIDGTVAAYRLPYLLAGNSLVFKQDSPFYEHFYHKLQSMHHYVPIKRDLSDLVKKISWAKENDDIAKKISQNSQQFVNDNLTADKILCYHVTLFKVNTFILHHPVIEISTNLSHFRNGLNDRLVKWKCKMIWRKLPLTTMNAIA